MRIQETDRILKESRVARHAHAAHEPQHEGTMARVWRSISNLPGKLTGMFHRG